MGRSDHFINYYELQSKEVSVRIYTSYRVELIEKKWHDKSIVTTTPNYHQITFAHCVPLNLIATFFVSNFEDNFNSIPPNFVSEIFFAYYFIKIIHFFSNPKQMSGFSFVIR